MTELRDWRSVRAEILRRIQDRTWPPGAAIPSETSLAAEFGCGRTTVNRAMRALADDGFLHRRRRAGTTVARHPVRRAKLDIPVTRLEIEARGGVWKHAVLVRRHMRPPASIAAALGIAPNLRILFLRSLHLSDGTPFLFEDRWINTSLVPGALQADFTQYSANEWLVHNASYTRGDMIYFACNANAEQAEILDTEPGIAILAAERITFARDEGITHVRLFHGPNYRLRAEL